MHWNMELGHRPSVGLSWFGAWKALLTPELRKAENLHSQDNSLYCSAFVQHLFRAINLEFAPGVNDKHTTPEDISRTPVPHTPYLLKRQVASSKLTELAHRVRSKIRR